MRSGFLCVVLIFNSLFVISECLLVTMSNAKVYQGKKGTKKLYPTRRRNSASSRRPLNIYETESDSKGVSASANEELSRDGLLNPCLGRYTQNSNEIFNATVWNLGPKSYSSGKKVLNIATDIAVCNFNDSLSNILQVIRVLEMEVGLQSYNFCLEADAKRVKHAEQCLTDAAKEARSNIKSSRKENEDENFNIEGQLYGPGIAD